MNLYLNDRKQLDQQQEQVFHNIVANLESRNVESFHLVKMVADNWNLFHNTSYPYNYNGLGGEMREAHAEELLVKGFINLAANNK